MTTLAQTLQADLTDALRARDELRMATLRMALSAVQMEAVSGSEARELTDAEVEKVLARELKRRLEAADAFAAAGRVDSAERERAEAEILRAYLPEPLTEAQTQVLVDSVIADMSATPKQTGRVIGEVVARAEGRADGAAVAALVRARLTG